ncbi:unnamed protein product [Nesidiocoris tenuis]|uniref:Uncharacterized protein n=1 Tax=Nesidiocoris tenuis TaxID=355587 RepID=A0A6H5G8E3_9HEMI|nr:unnamed protein product [Nesidiocoris tenuis]
MIRRRTCTKAFRHLIWIRIATCGFTTTPSSDRGARDNNMRHLRFAGKRRDRQLVRRQAASHGQVCGRGVGVYLCGLRSASPVILSRLTAQGEDTRLGVLISMCRAVETFCGCVQHLGVCSRRTSANEERRGQTVTASEPMSTDAKGLRMGPPLCGDRIQLAPETRASPIQSERKGKMWKSGPSFDPWDLFVNGAPRAQ